MCLKSNMDRFIDSYATSVDAAKAGLKSNMDRFIGCYASLLFPLYPRLKSNMDRFIAVMDIPLELITLTFKIQYG